MTQKEQSLKTDHPHIAEPRQISGVNMIGLMTLINREVGRFLKVYTQTIIAPVVTMLMFYAVFMLAFGGLDKVVAGVPFEKFLAPGLIMMTMAQNAFANTSSSIIISKVQGNIVDILMPPLSAGEIFWGLMLGGILRGLVVGFVGILTLYLVVGFPVFAPLTFVAFAVLGTMMMSALGIMGGIWADKFDHIAAFTNFVITPLTFLSGTFYSISVLPEIWQKLALYNPFFYMIDGFRSGFIGQSDSNIMIGLALLIGFNIVVCSLTYLIIRTGYKIKS